MPSLEDSPATRRHYNTTVLLNAGAEDSLDALSEHHGLRRAPLIDNLISQLEENRLLTESFLSYTQKINMKGELLQEKTFSFTTEQSSRLTYFSFSSGFLGNKSAAIRALCLFFAELYLGQLRVDIATAQATKSSSHAT